jgi:hypothetical protein
VNKMVLTCSVLVGLLCKIVTPVNGYQQDKALGHVTWCTLVGREQNEDRNISHCVVSGVLWSMQLVGLR